jgi:mono/diheme cytochrome c family protein
MNRTITYICSVATLFISGLIATGCGPSASERRGQLLFHSHCAVCHQDPPAGLPKKPPRLQGLFDAKQLPSGAPATDQQVRKTIMEGLNTMPAFEKRLSNADLDDLVSYLHILE